MSGVVGRAGQRLHGLVPSPMPGRHERIYRHPDGIWLESLKPWSSDLHQFFIYLACLTVTCCWVLPGAEDCIVFWQGSFSKWSAGAWHPKEQLVELRQHGVAGTLLRREVAGPQPVHCLWGLRPNTERLGGIKNHLRFGEFKIWNEAFIWVSCCEEHL